jgi:hypothetical protein
VRREIFSCLTFSFEECLYYSTGEPRAKKQETRKERREKRVERREEKRREEKKSNNSLLSETPF